MCGAASCLPGAIIPWPRDTLAKMIDPKSVSEQIMYCTVRLVGISASGAPASAGTGFFYNFLAADNKLVPVLVTNKHVVQSAPAVEYAVHAVPEGQTPPSLNVTIRTELQEWINHPDEKVDLCGVPFGPIANRTNPAPFFRGIGPDLVPSQQQLEDLDAVEDVVMAGYPNGLWDEENNYPLIRRGITASHPAIDFKVNGVATTVVDIAAFPGSSGSPVFIYNVGTVPNKNGTVGIGQRIFFLGVLFSGPQITTDGKIIIRNIPTVVEAVPQFNLMMNLGYIIKSKELEPLGSAIRERFGVAPPEPPKAKD
jgi:hypothetical protein